MAEGKVIRRLPSTGGKVIKMITYREMGDSCDSNDIYDTFVGELRGGGGRPGTGRAGVGYRERWSDGARW